MTKYYRTIVTIEILSDRPLPPDIDLEEINYGITDGDCSGQVTVNLSEELTAEQMANALEEQGSDPAFFNLLDDEDYE